MVRTSVDLSALVALPPAERLALVQALWDSLRAEPGALPVTDAERAVVAQCRSDLQRDPAAALSWEEVRAELWGEQDTDERAAAGEDEGQPGP